MFSLGLSVDDVDFTGTGVLAENIDILNPRFTPNTDGFDPDSCVDVVLRDSLIDTGDDGISIKSMNSTVQGSGHIQMPARNIHIYRVTVLSRNYCIGSATFGGVYDVVMEDCVIGDDVGSSPWAIKYKSHQTFPGTLRNHTYAYLAPTCVMSLCEDLLRIYAAAQMLKEAVLESHQFCAGGTTYPTFPRVMSFYDVCTYSCHAHS